MPRSGQLAKPGRYTQNPCSGHFECYGDFSPIDPVTENRCAGSILISSSV
jgi:hypothetical protein